MKITQQSLRQLIREELTDAQKADAKKRYAERAAKLIAAEKKAKAKKEKKKAATSSSNDTNAGGRPNTVNEELKLVEARDVIDRTAVELLKDISAKLDTLPERIADAMGREY
jgi:hypothetical protein